METSMTGKKCNMLNGYKISIDNPKQLKHANLQDLHHVIIEASQVVLLSFLDGWDHCHFMNLLAQHSSANQIYMKHVD